MHASVNKQVLTLLFPFIVVSSQAAAFSSQGSQSAQPRFSTEQLIDFAKKVERSLAAEGARVAIVARIGRPTSELPEGMRFTHVGFAVYSDISAADGRTLRGYTLYNLYQNDQRPDVSNLVQDYPVDFFSGVHALEAGIIIPSPELQERLLKVIASPSYRQLHDPRYSLIANPYTLGRQNCTEFVLDVINAAIYQTTDPKILKENLKAYFKAQPVHVNPLKLLLGSMFTAEVSLSDQESDGKPVTATFERISDYINTHDRGSKSILMIDKD